MTHSRAADREPPEVAEGPVPCAAGDPDRRVLQGGGQDVGGEDVGDCRAEVAHHERPGDRAAGQRFCGRERLLDRDVGDRQGLEVGGGDIVVGVDVLTAPADLRPVGQLAADG
jgi:hypothetical protein